MKKAIWSVLLLLACFTGFAQNRKICRLGIKYDISKNAQWGIGRPVITNIIPYSPAELVGIKMNDVIIAIDDIQTSELSREEVDQMLNLAGKTEMTLTIGNLKNPAKQILIKKECKKSNAITEDQLATAFSMYSLETTSEREFTCPFKTTVTSDPVDFGKFKTFAFSAIDENNSELETTINESIEKELTKKGMSVDIDNPDILIQTFYFFDKNPNYKGANKILVEKEPTYRYNFLHSKMEPFPFLSPTAAEAEAEYLLQFGFRLIDQKEVPGRILWECEANELLESSYHLDDYARIHAPLMCMQYP